MATSAPKPAISRQCDGEHGPAARGGKRSMTICTEKWMPRRMPMAAPMNVIHARHNSPTSSTQKNRTVGRSKVAETFVIT